MSSSRQEAFQEIDKEREYQDRKWGDIHNHGHSICEWISIMRHFLDAAEKSWLNDKPLFAREDLQKAVSVGVAALEQHGIVELKR